MEITNDDRTQAEVLLRALDKIGFKVSGVECLKLADSLTWLAGLRNRLSAALAKRDAEEKMRVERALSAMEQA